MSHPHIAGNVTQALHQSQSAWDVFQQAADLGFGEIHLKNDAHSGLRAIIAIHNTQLGPAIGGTRIKTYHNSREAIDDAMRLARGMTYKAAITGLPYGGGKAVIMLPETPFDRTALLNAYAAFVEQLRGRYITSVDVGSSVKDMDQIAATTEYVAGTSQQLSGSGDPSPYTALGVVYGIEAAVEAAMQRHSLQDLHVLIQGAGHVGAHLAKELHQRGARISISDINLSAAKQLQQEVGAQIVEARDLFEVECDVFAPCALGGVLNEQSIPRLKARIVAGAANNQLQSPQDGEALAARRILYAPDYVINAGGLISIALKDTDERHVKLRGIYKTLLPLCRQAIASDRATSELADEMAQMVLMKAQV